LHGAAQEDTGTTSDYGSRSGGHSDEDSGAPAPEVLAAITITITITRTIT
jgi:hypothetical protein